MHPSNAAPGRDFIGYGENPPDPKWPDGARIAVNFVINVEEGAERSFPDGDQISETALADGVGDAVPGRDLAAESAFEYGSRVGIWRLLDIFHRNGLPVTIFGCATALRRNPALCETIARRDYDVCAHGLRWIQHRELTDAEERREIGEAVRSIEASTGQRPRGWYCRYGPSTRTRALLMEEGGFEYDSDAYNDELPYWASDGRSAHLVVPYSRVHNDATYLRGNLATAGQFLEVLRDAFEVLHAEGARSPRMMSVGLHPRLSGHPHRAIAVQRFVDAVLEKQDVWVCRRLDIARHWRRTHPPRMSGLAESRI